MCNVRYLLLFFAFSLIATDLPAADIDSDRLRGCVYNDLNGNELRDADEPGIAGVRVSNGYEIVSTDSDGSYSIGVSDDTIVFLIKPRGYRTVQTEQNIPRFYYIHKPAGSPDLGFPGIEPTGPLPERQDFPLYEQPEPDDFRAVIFSDTQTTNAREIGYMLRDVVGQLEGVDAAFGVTLGDIVNNNLDLIKLVNKTVSIIGIPWHNVIGNHDINFDASHDKDSDETFARYFGPSYYAFDYGPVHFIVLDDIKWIGATQEEDGHYVGELGERQIAFIRNDLALIPPDQPVVFFMHIPIVNVEDRLDFYRLIEERPMCISLSGHTHFMRHLFIGLEDGWSGAEPHHHIISPTISGSWWRGVPDMRGIPHSIMRDGAPNGYLFLNFKDGKFSTDFRAASRPASYQMHIEMPEMLALDKVDRVEFYVNVFNGSERSTVEFRPEWSDQWFPMVHVSEPDPHYMKIYEAENSIKVPDFLPLFVEPDETGHLWKAALPPVGERGDYEITVSTRDMNGREYRDRILISINMDGASYGLRIMYLFPNSQAMKLGMKVDDIIIECDGRRITDMTSLMRVVQENTEKRDLPIILERDGRRIEMILKPGEIGLNGTEHYR